MHPQSEQMSIVTPSSEHLSLVLNKETVETLLKEKRYEKVIKKRFEDFMRQNQLKVADVQSLLDEIGVSNRGYAAIYKSLQEKLQQANIKVRYYLILIQSRKFDMESMKLFFKR